MKEDENKKPGETPEGMVRKTRKVRKKRRAPETESKNEKDADSLFSRAKELLIGMQEDDDDDYGPVDVAEQVRRLKNRGKDDDKPLDDVWGTKKRSASWLWIVLIGIIVPVVAIIIGITKLTGDADYDSGLVNQNQLRGVEQAKFDPGEGPLGWYQASSVGVMDEVVKVITAINEAEDPEEIEDLVRISPYRKINPIDLADWGKPLQTNSLSNFRWEGVIAAAPGLESETARGTLMVSGSRVDGEPFKAYFVHEGDKVVLDWDATTAWSELSIGEVAEQKPRRDTLVRCLLEKRPVYDWEFGEVTYSGYFISSPDRTERIIAYVPLNNDRNKQIDRDLKATLNYGSFITNRLLLRDVPVTLKVRHQSEASESGVFEITEFDNAGWVRP
ncbi:hypothetical protein V2O64_04795 [Verrucomicrobiaceae bacterium 227]